MALQKTIVTKGITVTNAYHFVDAVRVAPDRANIVVRTFKDAASSGNSLNLLDQKSYDVYGDNFTEYFGTPHASKNVLERAQDYLIAHIPLYADATPV